jgi:uncharacterized RDD family membrane protein YckC/tetratricopeptide (TPR) repeat protein
LQPPKFSTRAAAFHLDALLFSVAYEAMHIPLLRFFPQGVPGLVLGLIFVVATFLVFIVPTKTSGQTVGKRLYGLRVFKADAGPTREHVPLTWTQLIVRELVIKTISSTLLGFGFWQARRDPEGKAWHDQFCKTVVRSVRDESVSALSVKLLESVTSLVTVLAGVLFVVLAFAYTSLPLSLFQEKLAEAGIQIEGLSGSIGGGLKISKVTSRSLSLQDLEIELSLWPSWQSKRLVLDHVSLKAGAIVTETSWSWGELAQGIVMTLVQHSLGNADYDPESETGLPTETPALKFVIGELNVSNLRIGPAEVVAARAGSEARAGGGAGAGAGGLQLLELQMRKIILDNGTLSASGTLFRSPGLSLKSEDLQYSEGVLQITSLKGEVTDQLIPTLKKPLDFEVHGDLAVNEAQKKLEKIQGSFLNGLATFTLEGTHLTLKAEGLPFWDVFRTRLPLKTVSLRVNALDVAKSSSFMEAILSSPANYELDFCGRHDVAVTSKTATNALAMALAEKEAIDNAFVFRSQNGVITADNVDAFCGFRASSTPTPQAAATPLAAEGGTSFEEEMALANTLFRAGKLNEAMSAIQRARAPTPNAAPAQIGAFYSLKGWIYLYGNDPTEAAKDFQRAYSANADLSDIEGLIRAEEKKPTPNQSQIKDWTALVKRTVQATPSTVARLTPHFRQRLGL